MSTDKSTRLPLAIAVVDLSALSFGRAAREMGFREGRASLRGGGVLVAFTWDGNVIQRSPLYRWRTRREGYFLAG